MTRRCKLLAVFGAAVFLLAGCASERVAPIAERSPFLVYDEAGNRYLIKHNMGDTFFVSEMKEIDNR